MSDLTKRCNECGLYLRRTFTSEEVCECAQPTLSEPAEQGETPRTEDGCCAATPEDLCRSTLAHYEDVSSKAHSWSSVVPRAISFWFLEKPQLERELSDLRAKLAAAEKDMKPLKTIMSLDGKNLLARFYDYDYFYRVTSAIEKERGNV